MRDYRKAVELHLRALPHRNLAKIRDLASWLIVAIKENHQLPEPIIDALAREEEVKKAHPRELQKRTGRSVGRREQDFRYAKIGHSATLVADRLMAR